VFLVRVARVYVQEAEVVVELENCGMSTVVARLARVWVMARALVMSRGDAESGGRSVYTRQRRRGRRRTSCACLSASVSPDLLLPDLTSFGAQLRL